MKEQKAIQWKQLCEKPEEKMVTVTMPESSWRAFNCMIDYPTVGYHLRDETAMGRAEWNKELYPLPADYLRREDVPRSR